MDDLEAIHTAISEVTNADARDKVAAAQTAIDRYFRRLTNHPAVRAVKFAVNTKKQTQQNEYTISDQDGNDLGRILSQGDLNALALAIFLGLAASTKDSGTFGFVLMDDPSQSLDSEHKKRLVEVLNSTSQCSILFSAMAPDGASGAISAAVCGCGTPAPADSAVVAKRRYPSRVVAGPGAAPEPTGLAAAAARQAT